MNEELVKYVEQNILPKYQLNEPGHGIGHIEYVIKRSIDFANQAQTHMGYDGNVHDIINHDMVYVIAAYHDIGHSIDPKKHEVVSANIMIADKKLHKWFNESQRQIMYEAIIDHRASGHEPRNIYGKIVSSADRNTDIQSILRRTWSYRRNLNPTMSMHDAVEEAYRHVCEKFGDDGYAVSKMYFKDQAYDEFLRQIGMLIKNKSAFRKVFFEVNCLTKSGLRDKIEEYVPWNEQETADKSAMIKFIDSFDDVVTRENAFGHFTASAFVVNDYRTHAIMLHHNIMGDWIYPGGHADGEYDLLSVAMREVEEETGLKVSPMFGDEIFAIQAAPVKGHVKNGKYVPAHIHYDVLFMFKAKNEDMDKIRVLAGENTSVEWWELCDTFTRDDVVDWAKPVNRKIVQKMDY